MKWSTRKEVEVSNLVGYRGGAENAPSSENRANLRNVEKESAKDGRRTVFHPFQAFDRPPRILRHRTAPDDWKLGSSISPEML
jgi:hypothetical protein